MAIMRWDPFRELEQLERDMERMWSNWPFRRLPWRRAELAEVTIPAIDMWETNDAVMIRAAMPGIRPEDLHVSVSEGTLTIRGEFKRREEREGDRWHRQEIQYGTYERTLSLPPYANTDQVEANYENGVLTLRMPKREQARAKEIPIRVTGNGQQRTIEGRSQEQR
jgi:HSP20 family protein